MAAAGANPSELFPLISSFLESAGLHKAAKAFAADTKNWKDGSKARHRAPASVTAGARGIVPPPSVVPPSPPEGTLRATAAGTRRPEAGPRRGSPLHLLSLPEHAWVRSHPGPIPPSLKTDRQRLPDSNSLCHCREKRKQAAEPAAAPPAKKAKKEESRCDQRRHAQAFGAVDRHAKCNNLAISGPVWANDRVLA